MTMPAISDTFRVSLWILVGLSTFAAVVLITMMQTNLAYIVRKVIRKPRGRRPSHMPLALWGLLAVCIAVVVVGTPIASVAPRAPATERAEIPRQSNEPAIAQDATDISGPLPSEQPAVTRTDVAVPIETVTPSVASSPGPPPTSQAEMSVTPSPNYAPDGFCDSSTEPCYYLPAQGDSWSSVATQSAFQDSCRWPEIADLNRRPDGSYRNIGPLLIESGIFVPPPTTAQDYMSMILHSDGRRELVPACVKADGSYDLPCVYTVAAEIGASGLYYSPIALEFYGGYEKEEFDLVEWIKDANLVNACPATPLRLLPGLQVVVPNIP